MLSIHVACIEHEITVIYNVGLGTFQGIAHAGQVLIVVVMRNRYLPDSLRPVRSVAISRHCMNDCLLRQLAATLDAAANLDVRPRGVVVLRIDSCYAAEHRSNAVLVVGDDFLVGYDGLVLCYHLGDGVTVLTHQVERYTLVAGVTCEVALQQLHVEAAVSLAVLLIVVSLKLGHFMVHLTTDRLKHFMHAIPPHMTTATCALHLLIGHACGVHGHVDCVGLYGNVAHNVHPIAALETLVDVDPHDDGIFGGSGERQIACHVVLDCMFVPSRKHLDDVEVWMVRGKTASNLNRAVTRPGVYQQDAISAAHVTIPLLDVVFFIAADRGDHDFVHALFSLVSYRKNIAAIPPCSIWGGGPQRGVAATIGHAVRSVDVEVQARLEHYLASRMLRQV